MGRPPGSVPPSGEQHVLSAGAHRAVAVEVGGGLRSYTLEDWDVLDGYSEDEMCSGGRGQTLVPWPNRLLDGRYTFEGEEQVLPLTEPEKRNAIHGLARWQPWRRVEGDASRVVLELLLHPQPGYPFTLELRNEYALDGMGITVRTSATNIGVRPCPYGAGAHPYVTVGGLVDGAVLRAAPRTFMPSDERGMPMERRPVEGTDVDFRRPRPIGGTRLDTAFTDLDRDPDGLASVELSSPGGERSVRVWLDAACPFLMLFTGDTLAPARRRRGLGVEPMTCAPNAFRSGDGLHVLRPGETLTSTWGITPRIRGS